MGLFSLFSCSRLPSPLPPAAPRPASRVARPLTPHTKTPMHESTPAARPRPNHSGAPLSASSAHDCAGRLCSVRTALPTAPPRPPALRDSMTTPSSLFPAQPGCRKTHIHSNFLPRTPRRSAAGGAHRRQRRLTAAVAVRRPPPACGALCDGLAAAGNPPGCREREQQNRASGTRPPGGGAEALRPHVA